jgi:ribosomal protein S18 acetylase RimI-like enzyme
MPLARDRGAVTADDQPSLVACRRLEPGESEHVRWALYEAVSWNPDRRLPPLEALLDHPELARYHRDWARVGDLGVVAEVGGRRAGVAFCRLFTDDDHGHGYVDEATPELAIAVEAAHRGRGFGARLMHELAEQARTAGFVRLSLSVDSDNPALRLYERLGYRRLSRDEGGVRMLLELAPSPRQEAHL